MADSVDRDILLVEDDPRLRGLLDELLTLNGYRVRALDRGEVALDAIATQPPDLVVLDIGLPGIDGLEVCRRARTDGYRGPILILTARGEETDEVRGLGVGADDYLAKPVSPPRLLARLAALLRRTAGPSDAIVRQGDLRVDPASRRATLAGCELPLTTAEFDLLHLLASHAGETVPRERILQALRGVEYDGLDRSVDRHVSRLRRHLGDDPKRPSWVKTVHGVGYLLVARS